MSLTGCSTVAYDHKWYRVPGYYLTDYVIITVETVYVWCDIHRKAVASVSYISASFVDAMEDMLYNENKTKQAKQFYFVLLWSNAFPVTDDKKLLMNHVLK